MDMRRAFLAAVLLTSPPGMAASDQAAGVVLGVSGGVTIERTGSAARSASLGMKLEAMDIVVVDRAGTAEIYIKGGGVTPYELTCFFATFVMLQFWNLFNARRLGTNASALVGMTANPYFILIAVGIFIGTIALVQFGGEAFRTVPLAYRDWLVIVASTSAVLWGGEIVRAIRRSPALVPAAA